MPKFTPSTTTRKGVTHHFYATSMAEWKVDTDLGALITRFKKDKYTFAVYMVPLPLDANYEIEMFQPKVEGTQWLATYEVAQ